ncbi:Hypothetical predicted protein [Scomber scombrus]|uniref:Uncharacterized protein n=1 Tax=Scomber scombrus TaxID=13677 RepID=A0AAV1MTA8_SCOSC
MLRDRCMCNLEITGNLVITDAGPCTGFIYRATDMSPVRILGGSTWEPTSGQVMFTLMRKRIGARAGPHYTPDGITPSPSTVLPHRLCLMPGAISAAPSEDPCLNV